MEALRNVLSDLLYQLGLRGGLARRLRCVTAYYAAYWRGRRKGLSQADARRLALRELAGRGIGQAEVRVRHPMGMWMELDAMSASFMIREISSDRCYRRLPGFTPRPGWTVVDVGAHQGLYTLEAAARVGPGGRVAAFEPFPPNRARLEGNVRRAGFSDRISIVPKAAAASSGRAVLFVTESLSGNQSLVFRYEDAREIEIETVRLDDALEEVGLERVDLVKVDVEGAYAGVLDGAPRLLARRPRLVLEIEGGPAPVAEAEARLRGLGYKTTAFDENIVYAEPA